MKRVLVPALLLLLAGCGQQVRDAGGRLEENGVAVTVTLHPGPDGGREIVASFVPVEAGFHLYSKDLPADGVHGLGIPTALDVSGDLRADGPPVTESPVRMLRLANLDVELPVYPDGPVTFTLPVEQTGSSRAEVVVSYAACSEVRCLMPVTGRKIPLPFR
ncbi:hypothetical protein [Actinocrispum sp. NPDC049592]|uniref:hypothetical protein n=1 Tax=Actinocrispum sp. NPDC049592 TaxID=3154835 RepID=UPI00341A0EDD